MNSSPGSVTHCSCVPALLMEHPLLLAIPSSNLLYKAQEMQLVLGLSRKGALALLASDPTLALHTEPSMLRQKKAVGEARL